MNKHNVITHIPDGKPGESQRGITLIENLVAILILSIGLLGLAGLQASTFRSSKDATFRAIAAQQASDMVNRIRVNTSATIKGSYNAVPFSASPPSGNCNTSICNDLQLASFDAWEWNTANASLLPGGGGIVTSTPLAIVAPNPGLASTRYTVTVMWDADRSGATGQGCDPGNANDLKCVSMMVIAP